MLPDQKESPTRAPTDQPLRSTLKEKGPAAASSFSAPTGMVCSFTVRGSYASGIHLLAVRQEVAASGLGKYQYSILPWDKNLPYFQINQTLTKL
ncbi:MAG: hypothetical protein JWM59_1281 [Verrucomicrobiales bacterium]|nr:hypothetical protein [Verrucomicrobiales bacterium]